MIVDSLIEPLLWLLMGLGFLALLWLAGEGVEWCCDEFDDWQKSTFKNYADDDDFVAR